MPLYRLFNPANGTPMPVPVQPPHHGGPPPGNPALHPNIFGGPGYGPLSPAASPMAAALAAAAANGGNSAPNASAALMQQHQAALLAAATAAAAANSAAAAAADRPLPPSFGGEELAARSPHSGSGGFAAGIRPLMGLLPPRHLEECGLPSAGGESGRGSRSGSPGSEDLTVSVKEEEN